MSTEMLDLEDSDLGEVTNMSAATITEGGIYYAIQEIFDVLEQGGAVRIKAVKRKKEEIKAYLVAFIAGVRVDKFYTCHFSCREWNSLLKASQKIDEMDIKFIDGEDFAPTGKATRIVTI